MDAQATARMSGGLPAVLHPGWRTIGATGLCVELRVPKLRRRLTRQSLPCKARLPLQEPALPMGAVPYLLILSGCQGGREG